MNKKAYITPVIKTVAMRMQLLKAFSGGSTIWEEPQISNTSDSGNDDNRSRHNRNLWDDDNVW